MIVPSKQKYRIGAQYKSVKAPARTSTRTSGLSKAARRRERYKHGSVPSLHLRRKLKLG